MRCTALLVLPLLLSALAAPIPLTGYFCASCPSTPDPNGLILSLHPAYTTVIFAFAGWDATGTIQNQYDDSSKKFTLNASVVAALHAQGRKVLISAGGGAGNVLFGPPPAGFVTNFANGLAALVSTLGLDGVDFDLENFSGDPVKAMGEGGMRDVIRALRTAIHTPLLITLAPQMTDIFPDYPQITAGFNRFIPLIDTTFISQIDVIMPQMYNSWSAVETIAYAEIYTYELKNGFTATAPGYIFNVSLPTSKIALGYPASRSGAGSGFINPPDVVAMVQRLAANQTILAGLMTWDIGWDHQNNWEFANAAVGG
jgi:chitinase